MLDLLKKLAHLKTDNFCYSCYQVVEEDHCTICGCDDFMRHLDGVGVEYGYEWTFESILNDLDIESIDTEEMYLELLNECYDPIKVGYITWDYGDLYLKLDPIAFSCGESAYIDGLLCDGEIIEINGNYYNYDDLEIEINNAIAYEYEQDLIIA